MTSTAADAPVLSIGIPVRNGGRFLAEALERVRTMRFDGTVEVLVSDNASSDSTPEIIKAAAQRDPRLRGIRQTEDLGPADNFTYVYRNTTGEFFAWLAYDDLFAPTFHQRMVDMLRARPDAAAAMSRVQEIDPEGNLGRFPDEGVAGDHPDPVTRFIRYAGYAHFCQYCFAVVRRSHADRTQIMPPFWGGDRLFCAELALTGPLLRDPEPLFFLREHTDRTTHRHWRDPAVRAKYLTPTGSRAVTLYYVSQLWKSLARSDLSAVDRARAGRALRAWMLRNSHKIVRSAGRRALETISLPVQRVSQARAKSPE